MADATQFPSTLERFQWARPDATNPRLASPVSATDTDFSFTAEPQDETGTGITGDFLFGVTTNGYTETCYAPPGSISGTTGTGIVRGVRLSGIDYTTGDASLAIAHNQDAPVFCNVSAVDYLMAAAAIQGGIATGGTDFEMGDETATDLFLRFANDHTTLPYLYWDDSDGRFKINWGDDAPAGQVNLEKVLHGSLTLQVVLLQMQVKQLRE